MATSPPESRLTPKRLILSLLSVPSMAEVRVGHLIDWGRLFGFDPAAIRVAVGRLVRQGLIRSVARGSYSIGPEGRLIAETASRWARAEAQVGPWSGEWIIVHTSHLGRTNKSALRARERSFRLTGFGEWVTGLWCRPANYREPLDRTRDRLVSLGLEPDAVVLCAVDIPGSGPGDRDRLWPREQLEAGYRSAIGTLRHSARRLHTLDQRDAARESFLVGEAVIRQINADPLLPDRMIDTKLRRQMIGEMVQYNRLGRSVWGEFYRRSHPPQAVT